MNSRCKHIKGKLQRDKEMSVRLPRGSGFCVGNVVRESKTRTKVTMKERGGERGKDCDWDAQVVLCRELEGSFCCRTRGDGQDAG